MIHSFEFVISFLVLLLGPIATHDICDYLLNWHCFLVLIFYLLIIVAVANEHSICVCFDFTLELSDFFDLASELDSLHSSCFISIS